MRRAGHAGRQALAARNGHWSGPTALSEGPPALVPPVALEHSARDASRFLEVGIRSLEATLSEARPVRSAREARSGTRGSARTRPHPVRYDDRLPLLLRAVVARAGTVGGDLPHAVLPHRPGALPPAREVLGQDLPDPVRHGGGDRDRAGVPVRHELVVLLDLRR